MIRFFSYTIMLNILILCGCSSVKTVSTSVSSDSLVVVKNRMDSVTTNNIHNKTTEHVVSSNTETSVNDTRIDTVYIEKEHTIILRQSGDTISDNTNTKERLISHHYNNSSTSLVQKDFTSVVDSLMNEINRISEYADSVSESHKNDITLVKEKELSRLDKIRQSIGDLFLIFVVIMACILGFAFYEDRKQNK